MKQIPGSPIETVPVLSNIPVNAESFIKRIVFLAGKIPPKETKKTYRNTGPDKKPPSRASSRSALGPLNVEDYLHKYGIPYSAKTSGSKVIYRLDACLFDPSHTQNEAAIIQDQTGKITYQCFHNSCSDRTWHDARDAISGDDSLASFCAGYSPAPPQDPAAPSSPYFEGRKYIPLYLKDDLKEHFDPMLFDGQEFYHYNDAGVWCVIEFDAIGKVALEKMAKHAKTSRIQDAIRLLGMDLYRPPDEFRHNPQYLNVKNGMIDLQTMEMVDHDPSYNSRIQLPVAWKKGAPRDRWDQAMQEIFKDEEDKIGMLQSYLGYCLLPDCRFQKCMFLVGAGANGKSVITDVVITILGPENVSSLPIQLMGQRFLIGQLKDKLVNITGELATNAPIDTSNFKDAVAGGLLMADTKHGKPFAFYPVAKHLFSMNEMPKITDKSYGFQRRPLVLKFNQRFDGSHCDPYLTQKLRAEQDGIFEWMLEGLYRVLKYDALDIPELVRKETEDILRNTNPMLLYMEECCDVGPGKYVRPMDLYNSYIRYCTEGRNRPLSRNRFYDQLFLHFPGIRRRQIGANKDRMFAGLELKGIE